MHRRQLMKQSLLAVGALASGCSGRAPSAAPSAPSRPRRQLVPVRVSEERIIRTVVGLRPFRPPGFRVEKEKLGRKTVVHNYGHGGGGLTLSWGSSRLAVEELARDQEFPGSVAVLGAGALGLSAARLLQKRGVDVTIYAKALPPDTTSNVAAGQWSPYSVSDFSRRTERYDAQFLDAARYAFRHFQDLVGDEYGVRWLTNYVLSEHPFGGGGGGDPVQALFPESRELAPGEHPFPVPHVRQFVTMLIEPATYLNAVLRDFYIAGGRTVVRELHDVDEALAVPEPAIVNCTGLGAKALFGDPELTPIKGQLTFVLPQPEVDYITLFGDLYMMPRGDGVLLGGTHERGEWSLDVDEAARTRIVEGHRRFFEAMEEG